MYIRKTEADRWRALADAIVLQAVKDYRQALAGKAKEHCREIERFFRSKWFGQLTMINPELLIRKLQEEVHNT